MLVGALRLDCLVLLTVLAASAQDFPSRPVRMIVPFPSGGFVDVLARALAVQLGKQGAQPFIIENIGGAGGQIGTKSVESAPTDGHTLLFRSQWTDFDRRLTPVTLVAESPLVLVVPANLSIKNYGGFIGFLKGKRASFASSGSGTISHVAAASPVALNNADVVHVPYKGANPATIDLIAGRVTFMFLGVAAAEPLIKQGQVIPIAVTGRTRSARLPDVPTFSEVGEKRLEITQWVGMFAPRGTPQNIVGVLATKISQALKSPEIRKTYDAAGFNIRNLSGAEFVAFLSRSAQEPPACCAAKTCTDSDLCKSSR